MSKRRHESSARKDIGEKERKTGIQKTKLRTTKSSIIQPIKETGDGKKTPENPAKNNNTRG